MKLKGILAEKATKAQTKEELKAIIEDAGMELSENELDEVSGGAFFSIRKESSLNGGLNAGLNGGLNAGLNAASDAEKTFI